MIYARPEREICAGAEEKFKTNQISRFMGYKK